MEERAKGLLTVFICVVVFMGPVLWDCSRDEFIRPLKRRIAICEVKIETARKEKRIEKQTAKKELLEWYLEKAEWKEEWQERRPG